MGVDTIQPARVVEVSGQRVKVQIGAIRLLAAANGLAGGDVALCIRAEEVTVEKGTELGENRLAGIVRSLVREGPVMRMVLDCGFPLIALAVPRSLDVREGDRVSVHVPVEAVHLVARGTG